MIGDVPSPSQVERRLAELLLSKGVISRQEYEQTLAALKASSTVSDSAVPRVVTAAAHAPDASASKSAGATGKSPVNEPGPAQAQAEGPLTTMSKIPVKLYWSVLLSASYVSGGAHTIDMTLCESRFGLR